MQLEIGESEDIADGRVEELYDSRLVMLGVGALLMCAFALSIHTLSNVVTGKVALSWLALGRKLIRRALL